MSARHRWMEAVFEPHGVAVIGSCSDPSKLAWGTLQAVLRGRERHAVVAVDRHLPTNRKGQSLTSSSSALAFPSINDVPLEIASTIDLAVLVTKRDSCLERIRECIGSFPSLGAINVVSGGFRESANSDGKDLELQMVQEAHEAGIRLIGPNSVGSIAPYNDFASMFLRTFPPPGGLSLISQSGGVCGAIIELTCQNPSMGFSKILSLGNAADVGFVDALVGLREDPETKVVMLYLEGLGCNDSGDEFIEVARSVAEEKPIVALKAGITEAGSRAVSSHTGTLAGNEHIYGAALRASGIVEAKCLRSMLEMAYSLSCHPRVELSESAEFKRYYRAAVITNAGGPSALTVDALASSGAASVPPLSQPVQQKIRGGSQVHALSATSNPIDLLGGATPQSYRSAVQAVLDSPEIDVPVCIHVPTALSDPEDLARELTSISRQSRKPLVGMLVTGDEGFVGPAVEMLRSASIPVFRHPDGVADTMRAWKEREERFPLKEAGHEQCAGFSESQIAQGRHYLATLRPGWTLEHEARPLLDALGVNQPKAKLLLPKSSLSKEEIVSAAEKIGYPVVLKRVDDVHKSDKGGVALDLRDSDQVRDALLKMDEQNPSQAPILVCEYVSERSGLNSRREFFVGFARDESFGPVICFGSGGTLVEAVGDIAFAMPPRSRSDTLDLLSRARLASLRIAGGTRSEPPLDAPLIAAAVEQCSAVAQAFPEIAELDINPLMAGLTESGETRVIAADIKFRLKA